MTEPVPSRMPSTDQELEVWTRAFIQLLPRFGLEFSLEELAELADDALDQWRIRKRAVDDASRGHSTYGSRMQRPPRE